MSEPRVPYIRMSRSDKEDPKTCPICGQHDQVIPIVYGMPAFELFKKAERGLVHLGGCCISNNDPQWYCKRDGWKF